MTKKQKQKKCLVCEGSDLIMYLDLGNTALANAFIKKTQLKDKEDKFPLRVLYCKTCHLVQLDHIVDRKKVFSKYHYFSSASSPLEKYYEQYVKNLQKKFPNQTKGLIVEIGSNDGILLKYFKNKKTKTLGVDPAKNIAKLAISNGIETLPVFFNLDNAKKIVKKYKKASVVIANHVLAHTDDLHGVIKGVKELLDNDGVFVFEVQYLLDLIQKNEFDNTYHEHISYFSIAPLNTLLSKYGLKIFNIERVDAQGGSIRVYAGHTSDMFPVEKSIKNLIQAEKKNGLYNEKKYKIFGKKPEKIKKDLINLLKEIKKQNKTIVGYGASAKGNTLLQYIGIGPDILDYIVDTTPSKQGKLTPGTHIPVYAQDRLKTHTPAYVLILAWNYADIIIKKESWLQKKGVIFITPIRK